MNLVFPRGFSERESKKQASPRTGILNPNVFMASIFKEKMLPMAYIKITIGCKITIADHLFDTPELKCITEQFNGYFKSRCDLLEAIPFCEKLFLRHFFYRLFIRGKTVWVCY